MGFLDSEITAEGKKNVQGVLQDFGNELIEELVNSLAGQGLRDSNLAQSMNYSVNLTSSGWQFRLFFDEYGNYLDEGVQGKGGKKASGGTWRNKGGGSKFRFRDKKPPTRDRQDPTRSLETWATPKGLNVWAVRESIYRQGIKATHWFSDVVDAGIIERLLNKLEQEGIKELEIDISEQLKGIFNGK